MICSRIRELSTASSLVYRHVGSIRRTCRPRNIHAIHSQWRKARKHTHNRVVMVPLSYAGHAMTSGEGFRQRSRATHAARTHHMQRFGLFIHGTHANANANAHTYTHTQSQSHRPTMVAQPPTREAEVASPVSSSPLSSSGWSPTSWRQKEARQMPKYDDPKLVTEVEGILAKQAPLVFAGEVRVVTHALLITCRTARACSRTCTLHALFCCETCRTCCVHVPCFLCRFFFAQNSSVAVLGGDAGRSEGITP